MSRYITGAAFCGVLGFVITLVFLPSVAESRHPEMATPVAVESPQDAAPCPVTVPNGSTPPGERPSPDHHGNGALWTVLWPDSDVLIMRDTLHPDGALGMKFPWWRGIQGRLTIAGQRLDAPAPPLTADVPDGYGKSGFQASGIIFPSEGCWEITGRVDGESLTIVVRVVRLDIWGTPVATPIAR